MIQRNRLEHLTPGRSMVDAADRRDVTAMIG